MNPREITTGLLLLAALALAGTALAPPAFGQIPTRRGGPSINPRTLTDYAEAYLDIGEIDVDRASRLSAASDSAEIGEIRREADAAIERVLEEQEMTRADFDAIGRIIDCDAEVRQEFELTLARVRHAREEAQQAAPPR